MVSLRRWQRITRRLYNRWTIGLILILGVVLVAGAAWSIGNQQMVQGSIEQPFILLDPGHGGADGGAQAADGTLEKDINLAISLRLRDLLTVCGYTVRMTRSTDISIHDADVTSLRQQKVSDMNNRLKLYERAQVAIGIHQNHFSQSQYSGTQLFYSPNRPESQDLALSIQEQVVDLLQPGNRRQCKQASSDIFLLSKAKVPCVFVECGFLSNPTERDLLKQEEYQQQMAFAILCGIIQYAP